MDYECEFRFKEGEIPLGILWDTEEWEKLKEVAGTFSELSNFLIKKGYMRTDIDVLDMGAGTDKRGPYGLFCKTYSERGCEGCIFYQHEKKENELKDKAKETEDELKSLRAML